VFRAVRAFGGGKEVKAVKEVKRVRTLFPYLLKL